MTSSSDANGWSDPRLSALSREWRPAFDVVVRRALRTRRVDGDRADVLTVLSRLFERYAGHASVTPAVLFEIAVRHVQSLPCRSTSVRTAAQAFDHPVRRTR